MPYEQSKLIYLHSARLPAFNYFPSTCQLPLFTKSLFGFHLAGDQCQVN